MTLKKILAATAATAIATSALPAAAAVTATVTTQAAFAKLHPGIKTFDFGFTKDVNLGSSYTADGVTFTSKDMYGLNDKNTNYTSVLSNISGDFTIAYSGATLGLDIVSTKNETLSYTVNGIAETLKLTSGSPIYLGLDSGGATGLKVVFDASCSSSINLLGFSTAVPEAATWAMMMVGLGVVGGSLRRRRAVAPSLRFA